MTLDHFMDVPLLGAGAILFLSMSMCIRVGRISGALPVGVIVGALFGLSALACTAIGIWLSQTPLDYTVTF